MMYDVLTVLYLPLITYLSCLSSVSAAPITDVIKDQVIRNSIGAWLGIAAGAVVFCVVVVFFISQCTDCYNAEVSTDSHAACGSSKSYATSLNTNSSGSPYYGTQAASGATHSGYSHVQNTGAPLPYTLNPAPSSSQASAPPVGPGGLGNSAWGTSQPVPQQNLPQYGTGAQGHPQVGRHYTGPEQPPSYNEAISGTAH